MAHVHHFEYGWLTPGVAYGVSVLGSLLGLLCAARSRGRVRSRARRIGWMTLAATAIGGTGIWLMHFMAMIGFSVVGSDVRYEPRLTVLSALLAIGVVWLGLFILGTGAVKWYRVGGGGIVAGLGVATMHYTGMAAMRLDGSIGYQPMLVLASIAIAVTAATVALWFTVVARGTGVIVGAALLMGVAVTGMHYVAMAAARITPDPTEGPLGGVDVATALPPIAAVSGLVVVVLLYTALSTPEEDAYYFAATARGPGQQPGRHAEPGYPTVPPGSAVQHPMGFQPISDGHGRRLPPPPEEPDLPRPRRPRNDQPKSGKPVAARSQPGRPAVTVPRPRKKPGVLQG